MSLKKAVIANYFGQGWSALMGIAFMPLIIKYLGAEAYGLVGVFVMLQAWFSLLDMGMTPTLNREMARYLGGAHTLQSIRDLLRSLEIMCFAIALLIGCIIWQASEWLASHWLRLEKLSLADVAQAISIMAFVVSFRFIEGIYRGALMGLQKQVWLNIISSVFETLRWGGVILVLKWTTPSIKTFFLWQGAVSLASIPLFIFVLYKSLPRLKQSAKFSWIQLQGVLSFAGGMMAQALLALLLTQVDKVLLSRLLSLETFGYYTLATTFTGVMLKLVAPIVLAFFPRFSELVVKEDTVSLINIYHKSAQMVSIITIPIAVILVFFGQEILLLWSGNPILANNVSPILALLALGTMLNCLMQIPSILTIAYGRPDFFVRINIIAAIVLVPAIFWSTSHYGAVGASGVWLIFNLANILIASRLLHLKFLKTEMNHWYKYDIFYPFVCGTLTVIVFEFLNPDFSFPLVKLLWILASGLCAVIISGLSIYSIRRSIALFLQYDRIFKVSYIKK